MEDGGSVIEEVIRSGQLLQHLECHGESDAVEHARAGEGFVPGMVADGRGAHLFDLGDFLADHVGGFGEAVHLGHGGDGAGGVAVVVVEAGGFGHGEDAEAEDESPDETDGHGDAVGTGVEGCLGAVVYAVRCEDSYRDKELVAPGIMLLRVGSERENGALRDDSSSDGDGGGFGHVKGHKDGESSNTKTGYEASHGNSYPLTLLNRQLNDNPNDEHADPRRNAPFPPDSVGDWSRNQTAD